MTVDELSIQPLLGDFVRGAEIGVVGAKGRATASLLASNPITLVTNGRTFDSHDLGKFDTLVALASMQLDCPWRDSLQQWLSLVRPGGRLIFDAASADHIVAVASARCIPIESLLAADPQIRISGDQIFAFGASDRLAIRAIVPYGGIRALESSTFWLRNVPALPPSSLRRLLSWCDADPQLGAFVAFLERQLFGAATTRATGRFLVVIEKSEPDVASAAVCDRYIALERWITSGKVRLEAFAERSEIGVHEWFSQLRTHLEFERNRVFAALLLSRAGGIPHFSRALSDLPGAAREEFNSAERMLRVDTEVSGIAAVWASGFKQRELICDDVDLRGVFIDSMTRELLDRYWFKL